jgi:hypothetical protein
MESLGVPDARPEDAIERDPAQGWWRIFAANYHLVPRDAVARVARTTSCTSCSAWRERPRRRFRDRIYDQIGERLKSRPSSCRARCSDRFQHRGARDDRRGHRRSGRTIARSGSRAGTAASCRPSGPDALFRLAAPTWRGELATLERVHGAADRQLRRFPPRARGAPRGGSARSVRPPPTTPWRSRTPSASPTTR